MKGEHCTKDVSFSSFVVWHVCDLERWFSGWVTPVSDSQLKTLQLISQVKLSITQREESSLLEVNENRQLLGGETCLEQSPGIYSSSEKKKPTQRLLLREHEQDTGCISSTACKAGFMSLFG